MKLLGFLVAGVLFLGSAAFAEEGVLKTQKEKISYILGADIGSNLKRQGIDVELELVMKGIKDALTGSKLLLNEKEITEIMTAFRQEFTAKQAEATKVQGEKNRKEGDAFLSENAKKEGIKILPSGLQYKVIKDGEGKSPKASDTVVVNYRGTLIDGTEFDSSFKRGQSATFPVSGVIPGWTEALQLMKEGAKWQIYLPSNLAYGERGAGAAIGPNSVLVFDVELVAVKETPAEKK